ncbi:uncharacterized protein ACNLHF_011239 isoform 1-T2 [Anomaloglossus baeobatrachus]
MRFNEWTRKQCYSHAETHRMMLPLTETPTVSVNVLHRIVCLITKEWIQNETINIQSIKDEKKIEFDNHYSDTIARSALCNTQYRLNPSRRSSHCYQIPACINNNGLDEANTTNGRKKNILKIQTYCNEKEKIRRRRIPQIWSQDLYLIGPADAG